MELWERLVLLKEGRDLEAGPGRKNVVELAVLLVVRDVQVDQLVQLRQHAHLSSIRQVYMFNKVSSDHDQQQQ